MSQAHKKRLSTAAVNAQKRRAFLQCAYACDGGAYPYLLVPVRITAVIGGSSQEMVRLNHNRTVSLLHYTRSTHTAHAFMCVRIRRGAYNILWRSACVINDF